VIPPQPTRTVGKLLEPIQIGRVRARNRVLMTPMTTRFADADGSVTGQLIAHYEARARGGTGTIIVELSSPHPSGAHRRREVGIHSDRYIGGLSRLAERVHRHGALVGIQIGHAGAHARPDVTGYPAVAPSSTPHTVHETDIRKVRPRPLAKDEIEECVGWYAEAAARVVRAGFDLVEIQGGHDYLIKQFLSPLDNTRQDEFGGDLEGRARFGLAVVAAVRSAIGSTPISFRYSVDEFARGGFSRDDGVKLAPMLCAAGCDLISVSGGSANATLTPSTNTTPMAYPPGLFVPLAEEVRRRVTVPVAVANRIHDPVYGNDVIAAGKADMIGLGRALLADPDWVLKVEAGQLDRIRPCLACNTCTDHLKYGRPIRCVVNPSLGRDAELALRPAREPRTVAIVGAGPAGMAAALRAAERGHRVVLLEEAKDIGGRLLQIPRAPYFQSVRTAAEPFERLVAYFRTSILDDGVEVRTAVPATSAVVQELRPDVVVLAEGARYPVPGLLRLLDVPGLRALAGIQRFRKVFFKLLRPRPTTLIDELEQLGIATRTAGDRSGSRGVEAAILSGTQTADGIE